MKRQHRRPNHRVAGCCQTVDRTRLALCRSGTSQVSRHAVVLVPSQRGFCCINAIRHQLSQPARCIPRHAVGTQAVRPARLVRLFERPEMRAAGSGRRFRFAACRDQGLVPVPLIATQANIQRVCGPVRRINYEASERWMSGLSRTPGKRVGANNPPRVRIPPSPPVHP